MRRILSEVFIAKPCGECMWVSIHNVLKVHYKRTATSLCCAQCPATIWQSTSRDKGVVRVTAIEGHSTDQGTGNPCTIKWVSGLVTVRHLRRLYSKSNMACTDMDLEFWVGDKSLAKTPHHDPALFIASNYEVSVTASQWRWDVLWRATWYNTAWTRPLDLRSTDEQFQTDW